MALLDVEAEGVASRFGVRGVPASGIEDSRFEDKKPGGGRIEPGTALVTSRALRGGDHDHMEPGVLTPVSPGARLGYFMALSRSPDCHLSPLP